MKPLHHHASASRFLLGGIGTGTISLDQNARLCDWELWNLPNKGFQVPYNFFAVRTEEKGGTVKAKALEGQMTPPFNGAYGFQTWETAGIPRFAHVEMAGDYPFVHYSLSDESMPVDAFLEAYTPLIPLATDDSSKPVAILKYTLRNKTDEGLVVSVAGSMPNMSCYLGQDSVNRPIMGDRSKNVYVEKPLYRGLQFTALDAQETDLSYFESALVTTEREGVSVLEHWDEGAWWDGLQDFWNDFMEDGALTSGRKVTGKLGTRPLRRMPAGSLCIKKVIPAKHSADFVFLFAWYRPNRVRSWWQNREVSAEHPIIRNYYAKFGPPLNMLDDLLPRLPYLEEMSRRFAAALRSGSIPEYVADAISATITVIRSNTCFRVEDGTFFAWEGNHDNMGRCEGNCTHVWGYTQTMAFLFPELERSMRRTEFLCETNPDGKMNFRARRYLGDEEFAHAPAADGQLSTITRLYRDWMLCGDETFLKQMWPNAKKALDYACSAWDTDGDGLLDGEQHNTYDVEFFGETSMINTIYFAALRCGCEISRYLGDEASAARYEQLALKGAEKLDALTFNGEYYIQNIADINEHRYQYGTGCLADQLFGQQLAHVNHLGYVLDRKHVKTAIKAVFDHNFQADFSHIVNLQRTYALNHDAGLQLCTWPHGGRPVIPFPYCDEVWTGSEYQVASHLIYEGFVKEGLRIVEALRNRHDGIERNPWNEVECGHHYARSLASYSVLLALSGFFCDAVNKKLYFNPAINQEDFQCFFCCPAGWGIYKQKKLPGSDRLERTIDTLYGDLSDYTIA